MDESEALERGALRHFDALEAEYVKATAKYAESLRIKPDFYEAALAWGTQAFERGKLLAQRAAAAPKKVKAADVDAAFATSCKKFEEALAMVAATEAAAKAKEAAGQAGGAGSSGGAAAAAAAGEELEGSLSVLDTAAMTKQLLVLWGNTLYEQSVTRFKRGDTKAWRADVDAAVTKFRAAQCPEEDVAKALANHPSGEWKEAAAATSG